MNECKLSEDCNTQESRRGEIGDIMQRLSNLREKLICMKDQAKQSNLMKRVAFLKVEDDLRETRKFINDFEASDPVEGVVGREDLLPAIGGSSQLEVLISRLYTRMSRDNRLRAYFELGAPKMRCLRGRLQIFLERCFGNTTKPFDLKAAHYHLNISDFHVDAFLENFAQEMHAMGIESNIVAECISRLSEARSQVTTGYTVRCELARINTSGDPSGKSLCDRIGGLEGVIGFVDKFYEIIAKDRRISSYFVGHNFEKIKRGQRAYITELIGGPKLYRGRTLEEIHENLGINDYLFDCYVQDALLALKQCENVSEALSDQVLIQLESVRPSVVGQHRGVSSVIHQEASLFNSNLSSISRTSFTDPLEAESLSLTVDKLFEICAADQRLSDFFAESDHKRRDRFKLGFLNCLLTISGGEVMYDLTQLRDAHYDLDITDVHFDVFLAHFKTACNSFLESEVTEKLFARLSKLRTEITSGFTIRSNVGKCPFSANFNPST